MCRAFRLLRHKSESDSQVSMKKYQSPFNFPDEHMRLVGIIAAHSECLNLIIEKAVAYVTMNKQSQVQLLTSHLGLSQKLDILTAYFQQFRGSDDGQWKESVEVFKTIRKAIDLRNEFVHARWLMEEPAIAPHRLVIRIKSGKLIEKFEKVEHQQLEDVADFIHNTGEKLTQLLLKIGIESE